MSDTVIDHSDGATDAPSRADSVLPAAPNDGDDDRSRGTPDATPCGQKRAHQEALVKPQAGVDLKAASDDGSDPDDDPVPILAMTPEEADPDAEDDAADPRTNARRRRRTPPPKKAKLSSSPPSSMISSDDAASTAIDDAVAAATAAAIKMRNTVAWMLAQGSHSCVFCGERKLQAGTLVLARLDQWMSQCQATGGSPMWGICAACHTANMAMPKSDAGAHPIYARIDTSIAGTNISVTLHQMPPHA